MFTDVGNAELEHLSSVACVSSRRQFVMRACVRMITISCTTVLFKLVKPRTTAQTRMNLAVDQSSSWTLHIELTDEAALFRRPTTTKTWHVTGACQENHMSLVNVAHARFIDLTGEDYE